MWGFSDAEVAAGAAAAGVPSELPVDQALLELASSGACSPLLVRILASSVPHALLSPGNEVRAAA